MDETTLRESLAKLGIGADDWRSVLVLPLVQVAWADATIQDGERSRIAELGRELGANPTLVDRWLQDRPSDADLALARDLIAALAHRQRGLGSELDPAVLTRIEALSFEVARAAGGLFGLAFTVAAEEREAIRAIARDLEEASERYLEQLPTPETGSFGEL